jgi:hypothetical protein
MAAFGHEKRQKTALAGVKAGVKAWINFNLTAGKGARLCPLQLKKRVNFLIAMCAHELIAEMPSKSGWRAKHALTAADR